MRAAMLRATENRHPQNAPLSTHTKRGARMGMIECLDSASAGRTLSPTTAIAFPCLAAWPRKHGFSIYSPPFQNIFTYSDSEARHGQLLER
jgi:hypothetical protein